MELHNRILVLNSQSKIISKLTLGELINLTQDQDSRESIVINSHKLFDN